MFSFCFVLFAYENMKKLPSKVAHKRPIFFQYCQPTQIQPISQFLFHKNLSSPDYNDFGPDYPNSSKLQIHVENLAEDTSVLFSVLFSG